MGCIRPGGLISLETALAVTIRVFGVPARNRTGVVVNAAVQRYSAVAAAAGWSRDCLSGRCSGSLRGVMAGCYVAMLRLSGPTKNHHNVSFRNFMGWIIHASIDNRSESPSARNPIRHSPLRTSFSAFLKTMAIHQS